MLLSEKRKNKKAFMLLEVIISVLIIASGLMLVVRSYSASLKASRLAAAVSKAGELLEDEIFGADMKGFKDGIEEQNKEGSIDGEPGYNWYLNAAALDTKEKALNTVNMGVTYKFGNQLRVISISTYFKYKEG